MDIDVTRKAGDDAWLLTDLLGRAMGRVVEASEGEFRVEPAGQALKTMEAMKRGPFPTLDEALAEIERFTRSVCRRVDDEGPAADAVEA